MRHYWPNGDYLRILSHWSCEQGHELSSRGRGEASCVKVDDGKGRFLDSLSGFGMALFDQKGVDSGVDV